MNKKGRVQNSIYNLISGFGCQLLSLLTSFAVRTVFIRCLNADYLGVNGLYSSILSMLSLAELGFGTAMVYSMYRPLSEHDSARLAQLMQFYKTVYRIIGTVILAIGLGLIPFLDVLVKDRPDVDGLTFYYILFLLDSVFSYWFFAYRLSLLHADQKAHIIANYQSVFNLLKSALQVLLLLIFHSFTLYLLMQIACTVGQNIALAVKVQKTYPLVMGRPDTKLPKEDARKIFRDVKALMLGKISFVTLNSADNLIISAFVGISWVGLLSNYVMITEAITGILSQVTSAITASIGNFFAKEDQDAGYALFRRIDFLNFWLYGFSMIALSTLMDSFVTLWLGERFALGLTISIALAIRFFMEGYMRTLSLFRSTLGLFVQGQYLPLVSTVVNIALSIAMSYPMGAAGVLLATPITRLLVQAWHSPKVILNHGFHRSVLPYYKLCLGRGVLLSAVLCLCLFLSKLVLADGVGVFRFVVLVLMVAVLPNLIFALVFCRTDEFRYFCALGRRLCAKVLKR